MDSDYEVVPPGVDRSDTDSGDGFSTPGLQPENPGSFDILKFLHEVGEAVPGQMIERLQQECGSDISLAIAKYREYSAERNPAENGLPGSDTAGIKSSSTRKAISYSDQECINRAYNWNLGPSFEPPRVGSLAYNGQVLLVRRIFSEKKVHLRTVVDVQGPILRNVLRNIFIGTDGVVLDDGRHELQPEFLFWAKSELLLVGEHFKKTGDIQGSFEIAAATKFINDEWGSMSSAIETMLPDCIMFQHLWAIMAPGTLVVGKDILGKLRAFDIRETRYCKLEDGTNGFYMKAEFADWNGKRFGLSDTTMVIPEFSGTKNIDELPYAPLHLHPKSGEIEQHIIQRTKKQLEFVGKGYPLQEYSGCGLTEIQGVDKFDFQGRIVVDPVMLGVMGQVNPYKRGPQIFPNLKDFRKGGGARIFRWDDEEPDIATFLRAPLSKLNTDPGAPTPQDGHIRTTTMPPQSWPISYKIRSSGVGFPSYSAGGCMPISLSPLSFDNPSEDDDSTYKGQAQPSIKDLSVKQMLLFSGLVYGYSLADRRWGAFSVDQLSEVRWDHSMFQSLVMDNEVKDMVLQLIRAHKSAESNLDDTVKAKAKGLTGLFNGPPGLGKTFAVEAIAEMAHMPLYTVSGKAFSQSTTEFDPYNAGGNHNQIFDLARRWKAILLIDEADAFLAKRGSNHAMAGNPYVAGNPHVAGSLHVAAFYSQLECHSGIMILTSNHHRILNMLQNRVDFRYQFSNYSISNRRKIWTTSIAKARMSKEVQIRMNGKDIEKLASMDLNGHQIKNIMNIAFKLAVASDKALTTGDILSVARCELV